MPNTFLVDTCVALLLRFVSPFCFFALLHVSCIAHFVSSTSGTRYDLADPWDTPVCGPDYYDAGGHTPHAGAGCCVDKQKLEPVPTPASPASPMPPMPACVGDHRGEWALNDTRDWAGLGTLHPRVKRPIGRRLAQVRCQKGHTEKLLSNLV